MCRNADSCIELDTDPKKWSRTCPLQPPKYFDRSLNTFIKAYTAANAGEINRAIELLSDTRGEDLRNWYIEHGQMSGWHFRVKGLKKPKPKNLKASWRQIRALLNMKPKFINVMPINVGIVD